MSKFICTNCQRITDRLEKPCIKCGSEDIEAMHNENKKYWCHCKGCKEERERELKQFTHPFYAEVDHLRDRVKHDTLVKAAKKYDEPFNPHSWSLEQLLWHGMAENYDQGNYIVGLYEKAEAIEREKYRYKQALQRIAYDDRISSKAGVVKVAIEALEGLESQEGEK